MIRKYTQILLHNKGPLSRVKDFDRALPQLKEESSSYSNPSMFCLIYGVGTQIVNRGTGRASSKQIGSAAAMEGNRGQDRWGSGAPEKQTENCITEGQSQDTGPLKDGEFNHKTIENSPHHNLPL